MSILVRSFHTSKTISKPACQNDGSRGLGFPILSDWDPRPISEIFKVFGGYSGSYPQRSNRTSKTGVKMGSEEGFISVKREDKITVNPGSRVGG